jgi:thiamine-phosphate pyrophosphorylase
VFDLYIITDGTAPEAVVPAVRAALAQVPPQQVCVQLRAKLWPARQQLSLALSLREVCQEHSAKFLINDRVDIALSVHADGVHLPEQGLPVEAARHLLGPSALIGTSCHDRAGLERAATAGASFATLSPVFATPGKGQPLGVERFAALSRDAALPIFALGGVQPEHALQLRAAGAAGLAAISAIFGARDPGAAALRFLSAWQRAG